MDDDLYEDNPLHLARNQRRQFYNPRSESARTPRRRSTGELIDDFSDAYVVRRSPRRIPDAKEKGSSQLELINHYRRNVLHEAHQSFRLALVAAAIGLIFYIAAVTFLLLDRPASISITSLISGSLVELISAINFYLYSRASRQLASFHLYLDRTCRFIASEDACEKITDNVLKDRTRSVLILAFMDASNADFNASDIKNYKGP